MQLDTSYLRCPCYCSHHRKPPRSPYCSTHMLSLSPLRRNFSPFRDKQHCVSRYFIILSFKLLLFSLLSFPSSHLTNLTLWVCFLPLRTVRRLDESHNDLNYVTVMGWWEDANDDNDCNNDVADIWSTFVSSDIPNPLLHSLKLCPRSLFHLFRGWF